MDLPDDDHLSRAVTELGEPDALFRVSAGRFLTKLSVGLSLLGLGIAANYWWWWVQNEKTLGHVELFLLLILPLSGIALLLHMYRQRGLFVLVYPVGLLRLQRGEVDSFPWREVDHVRVKVQKAAGAEVVRAEDGTPTACWLPAEVPTFQLWTAGLVVARTDGVESHFGPAITDYDVLAAEVQQRTFAHLWPVVWGQFLVGTPVPFGDLEVSRAGLRNAGKFLPWPEFKELVVTQGKLTVKQHGKWLPWAMLDIQAVPNPHVLFALADEARRTALLMNKPRPRAAE